MGFVKTFPWVSRGGGLLKQTSKPCLETNPNGERHWANGLSLQYVEGEPEEAGLTNRDGECLSHFQEVHMGVSKNRDTPKWMVYKEKPY